MKRRDFMKAVALAPAGTLAGAEKATVTMVADGTLVSRPVGGYYMMPDPHGQPVLWRALQEVWGPDMHGRKIEFTVHKDGLDVRFV